MSLEGARRVEKAISDDWHGRMLTHESRVSGHDDVRLDPERQIVAWLRVGMLMLEAPAELIGSFFPELGLFRWWWSGKENSIHIQPARLDEAFAHAQRADLRALLTRQHQLDNEEDAAMLCRLAAYFSHSTALLRQDVDDRINFYAVFAANTRAPIIPDRDVVRTLPPPAVAPVPQVDVPPPPVREPGRALLLPLVYLANNLVRQAFNDQASRALLIINVDISRDKARFFVTLVATTKDGDLGSVDTTRDLLDSAGNMLAEDARTGNGRWRKLVIRIDCEGEGASIGRCEVSA